MVRGEVETEITKDDFDDIANMGKFPYIQKTRYNIPLNKIIIELDVYKDMHGLIIAEIEFETVDEAKSFNFPS